MIRSRKLGMIQAAALVGVASFMLVGCSSDETAAPAPADDGNDSAATEVTPFGTWALEADESVELVIGEDGTFEFKPCSATGKWSEEGDHFSAELDSMLDVGGCPETIDLALIDRITVKGEALVVSDSEGNEEAFQKLSD